MKESFQLTMLPAYLPQSTELLFVHMLQSCISYHLHSHRCNVQIHILCQIKHLGASSLDDKILFSVAGKEDSCLVSELSCAIKIIWFHWLISISYLSYLWWAKSWQFFPTSEQLSLALLTPVTQSRKLQSKQHPPYRAFAESFLQTSLPRGTGEQSRSLSHSNPRLWFYSEGHFMNCYRTATETEWGCRDKGKIISFPNSTALYRQSFRHFPNSK